MYMQHIGLIYPHQQEQRLLSAALELSRLHRTSFNSVSE